MKRISFPTPDKEVLGEFLDIKENKYNVSTNNKKELLKIESEESELQLTVEGAVKLRDKLQYFIETNSSGNDTIKVPRGMQDTIFNRLLIDAKTPFVKSNEEKKQYLQYLWDIEVSTRFKEEALWNEKFREMMDYWELEYAEDMENHGPGLNPEEDDDEE